MFSRKFAKEEVETLFCSFCFLYEECFSKCILYIKATMVSICLFVCLTNRAGQGRLRLHTNFWTNQMVLSVCGDKQGRAGQGQGRARRPGQTPTH